MTAPAALTLVCIGLIVWLLLLLALRSIATRAKARRQRRELTDSAADALIRQGMRELDKRGELNALNVPTVPNVIPFRRRAP